MWKLSLVRQHHLEAARRRGSDAGGCIVDTADVDLNVNIRTLKLLTLPFAEEPSNAAAAVSFVAASLVVIRGRGADGSRLLTATVTWPTSSRSETSSATVARIAW